MSDLSGIINSNSPSQAVAAWHEAAYKPRNRLGLSEVGHKCPRWLWFKHHNQTAIPPEGRILRLFRLGEMIEEQVVIDLMSAGYIVHSRQKEVNVDMLTGHIDGIIEGLVESRKPHLLEIKSANNKSFTALKSQGYEKWNEKYKTQIHIYMLLARLDRCLVWVENKDTSESYTERIDSNRGFAIAALERVMGAILCPTPPPGTCPNKSWYEFKFCIFRDTCKESNHNGREETCRPPERIV